MEDVKFKKKNFLQKIKVHIVWMTTVFFLTAEGENYPLERGVKVRGEKIVCNFFAYKWFRKDYKDDPCENFC